MRCQSASLGTIHFLREPRLTLVNNQDVVSSQGENAALHIGVCTSIRVYYIAAAARGEARSISSRSDALGLKLRVSQVI